MTADKPRPAFKPVRPANTYVSPEELFYKLSRESTHGYLRGPQQDVLREYAEKYATATDVAFELPTGTGKTAVGLLIAAWKQLPANKVAYLSLTNQLAGQVLAEGKKLGVPCADLRGTKETRSAAEEGRYRTGAAIAVTTYSNLFNVNPVLQECDLLIFDDAHGGEQYVANMWTVGVDAARNETLYNSLLTALRPALSGSQIRAILDKSSRGYVEMADIRCHPECIPEVSALLDQDNSSISFAWRQIRNKVISCLFLISSYEIAIRPLVPPTHTHEPFASAKQRIYMSATLGGGSDLQRSYGIEKLGMIRAKSSQWGRRYIFVPGIYASDIKSSQIVASAWDEMRTRRAVLLAPSDRIVNHTFEALEKVMTHKPARLGAADIANTMDGFIANTEKILALAGRYDGLDLPDDQCRLLILSESPGAINPLEQHLSERWKMGPVLRKRERTRLVQGMGRCTRNATDFAVIVWLGQSLVNAATSNPLLEGLPAELRAEVIWGVQQSNLDAAQLVSMIVGLIEDPDYRKAADANISAIQAKQADATPRDYEEAGQDEVRYSKAMWDDNFEQAMGIAHGIADRLNSPELAGYRAWWWYLCSISASLANNTAAEQDALRRGAACGVNSGWINQLLRERKAQRATTDAALLPNAEGLWDSLSSWGWAGPTFESQMRKMQDQLKNVDDHKSFHEGLEILGKCFGATTTRITEQGAPDVVWSFPDDLHLSFEAKTGKKQPGTLSKSDVQEAKGHSDWAKDRLCLDAATAELAAIVVASSPALHQIALPFASNLFYASPENIQKLAAHAAEGVRKLRISFAGREFAEASKEFSAGMRASGLDIETVKKALLSEPLKK